MPFNRVLLPLDRARSRAASADGDTSGPGLLDSLLSVVAPPLCWSCRARARSGPLCARCRAAIQWLGPEPAELRGVGAWAPVAYEGPARELVKALKFRGARAVAETMAAQVAAGLPVSVMGASEGPTAGAALVPVPLHPRRERRRGFNQARVLADALAPRVEAPVCDCLKRGGSAAAQVGRGRGERIHGPSGSIRIRPGAAAPTWAVLVDDVITTGATLAVCASVLRGAGVRRLVALAYARTPAR